MCALTSSMSTGRPTSLANDVTPRSAMPQGTIKLKKSRSVFTFSAKPCMVTHRLHLTPNAQIFLACDPILGRSKPRQPFDSACLNPILCARQDDRLLQEPQVFVDVREKLIEVQNRVPHQLTRPVVSDVTSSIDGKVLDAQLGQPLGGATTLAAAPLLPSVNTCGCSTQNNFD